MPDLISPTCASSAEGQTADKAVCVSGYALQDLQSAVFSRLDQLTGTRIRKQVDRFTDELESAERCGAPVFISVGENCGPALRLQEASAPSLGGGFFDFLVLRPGALERLLHDDFAHMLMLKNLQVGLWEGNESVYDDHYGVWYHHLFHLPQEKQRNHARAIDETDIPLLLSVARSQFEYLHEKLRLALRSPLPKILVYRAVDGQPLPARRVVDLSRALEQYGARNWSLAVVYSAGELEPAVADLHHRIPEPDNVRWGDVQDWRHLVAVLLAT